MRTKSMTRSPSQARDDWYQDAAKAQIQSERMTRAELLNGRVAMLGFLIGLLTEMLTGQGIVGQLASSLSF